MYPATPTFWLEPTDEVAVGLRRYSHGDGFTCAEGYHSALRYIGRAPVIWRTDEHGHRHQDLQPETPRDDGRWPSMCDRCSYRFTEADERQDWSLLLWRRTDTGELRVLHQNAPAPFAPTAEPGATWDAWWLTGWPTPDGIHLQVRLPNGEDWDVDSQASNCGRKDERPRTHFCWVRHGDPRECHVTVDKNGDTCSAGAGSIQAGDYHGFLRDGVLTAG